jgi:hypothetical protein
VKELVFPNNEMYPNFFASLLSVNNGKSVLAGSKYMSTAAGSFYYDYQFSLADGSFEGMYTGFAISSGQIFNNGAYVGDKSSYNIPAAIVGGKTWFGSASYSESLVSSDGIYLALPPNQGFYAFRVAASKTVLYFSNYNNIVNMYSAVTGASLGTITLPQVAFPLYEMNMIRCVSSSGDRMFRLAQQWTTILGTSRQLYVLQSFDPVTPDEFISTYIGYGIESKMSCTNWYAYPQVGAWLGQRVNAADGSTVHTIEIAWNCYDGNKQRYYLATHEVSVKPTPAAPSRSPSSTQAGPTGPTGQPTHQPTSMPTLLRYPTTWPGMRRTLGEQTDATKSKSKVQEKAQDKSESAATATAAVATPKKRLASSSSSSTSSTSSAAAKRSKKAA